MLKCCFSDVYNITNQYLKLRYCLAEVVSASKRIHQFTDFTLENSLFDVTKLPLTKH